MSAVGKEPIDADLCKEKLLDLWAMFCDQAHYETGSETRFFEDHESPEDVISTFWFWLEHWVAKDIGRPFVEE